MYIEIHTIGTILTFNSRAKDKNQNKIILQCDFVFFYFVI